MLRHFRAFMIGFALLVPLALSGCGVKNAVSGQVTYEGKPAEWGYVQFTPDIDKDTDGPTVTLKLSNDGRFSSVQEEKSLVSGEYKVLVSVVTGTGPAPPTVERRMNVTIPEGGVQDLAFDITKKKPAGKKDAKGAEGDD
jgi:hypothetical protein